MYTQSLTRKLFQTIVCNTLIAHKKCIHLIQCIRRFMDKSHYFGTFNHNKTNMMYYKISITLFKFVQGAAETSKGGRDKSRTSYQKFQFTRSR